MSTISDIAERAGVSDVTVSRVLSGAGLDYRRPTFRERAERIVRIAEELGYRTNTSARAMRKGRSGSVTLLLGAAQTETPIPTGLLCGLHDAAADRDYTLNIAFVTDEQLADNAFVPKVLRETVSDGLIVSWPPAAPPRLLDLLERFKVPVIWLNRDVGRDTVRSDDVAAGRAATERLIELGHRRIAHIGCRSKKEMDHERRRARRKGYKAAMKAAGLEKNVLYLPGDSFLPKKGAAGPWSEVFRKRTRPTAVIAYSEAQHAVILRAAAGIGCGIPGDLSLVTFGDSRPRESFPVETWVVPHARMAREAFQMLLQKIDDPEEALPERVVPFTVAHGESVAPRRHRKSSGA